MNLPLIVSGLGVGILFGFTLQHGRFCMNTAFREVLLSRDFTVFRIYILALLISIVGANLMDVMGVIHLKAVPFTWVANVIGGYIFGIGMVLGGGCATGTLYRVGEGMIGSWVAFLGFMLTATSTLSAGIWERSFEAPQPLEQPWFVLRRGRYLPGTRRQCAPVPAQSFISPLWNRSVRPRSSGTANPGEFVSTSRRLVPGGRKPL